MSDSKKQFPFAQEPSSAESLDQKNKTVKQHLESRGFRASEGDDKVMRDEQGRTFAERFTRGGPTKIAHVKASAEAARQGSGGNDVQEKANKP